MSSRATKKSGELSPEPESFEAALERLEQLVDELEAGDVPLDKSLAAFEEGQLLIKYCEKKLNAAEQVLKQLSAEAKSALGENPLRSEDEDSRD